MRRLSVRRTIDVDDRRTWPKEISARVNEWAEDCKGTAGHTADLPLQIEDEAGFRALLRGHLLRVYHCTKLLPHESQNIITEGLRRLSAELLVDRIKSARAARAISASHAEQLLSGHVYATGEQQHREDQVCFVLSRQMFRPVVASHSLGDGVAKEYTALRELRSWKTSWTQSARRQLYKQPSTSQRKETICSCRRSTRSA
jgi:hypothetical protein